MKKIVVALGISFAFSSGIIAQVFMANTCEISFFSPTPIEEIKAINKDARPFLNTTTEAFQLKIGMALFKFEKPLMQEHFNENYVETEKFPYSTFKGKINEKIDFTKDGEYTVTVTGTLSLHGVDQERTIPGTVTVKGEEISISSTFKIKFSDHNINIPKLYSGVIPGDTEVKINATLMPFKK